MEQKSGRAGGDQNHSNGQSVIEGRLSQSLTVSDGVAIPGRPQGSLTGMGDLGLSVSPVPGFSIPLTVEMMEAEEDEEKEPVENEDPPTPTTEGQPVTESLAKLNITGLSESSSYNISNQSGDPPVNEQQQVPVTDKHPVIVTQESKGETKCVLSQSEIGAARLKGYPVMGEQTGQVEGAPQVRFAWGDPSANHKLEDKLDKQVTGAASQNSEHITKQEVYSHIRPEFPNKKTDVKKILNRDLDKEYETDQYDMGHCKRGKALIFNNVCFSKETSMENEVRQGAENDGSNIHAVMEYLGFDCGDGPYIDFRRDELLAKLKEVSQMDHSDVDCFCCVLMSHGGQVSEPETGNKNDVLYAHDNIYYLDEDVLLLFRDDNCPSLAGKPKLFFIQACRGYKRSREVELVEEFDADNADTKKEDKSRNMTDTDTFPTNYINTEPIRVTRIPCYKDFLVFYSTMPGYLSYRKESGSWFMRELCTEILNTGYKKEFQSVLQRVNLRVAYPYKDKQKLDNKPVSFKQMPWLLSMLTKDVYFKPKLGTSPPKKPDIQWPRIVYV